VKTIMRREGYMPSRICATAVLATACALIGIVSALAQAAGADANRGRELAKRVCTNCHVTDREPSSSVRTDIATFPAMADRIGVTAEQLAGAIIIPHSAMPSVQLTTQEIRDVVAYILSLKQTTK
jgi:mono/diheme cytochrome c family protein